jgi:nitric oxide reductase subunit B
MQTWASVEYGTWYARSAEFLQTGLMDKLRWMRMFGDTTFAVGSLVLGYFIVGLITGHSYDRRKPALAEKDAVGFDGAHAHAGD